MSALALKVVHRLERRFRPVRLLMREFRMHRVSARPSDRRDTVDYPLSVFNIELTNKCPFSCVMCPRSKNMTRDQGLMDFEVFAKVVDEYVAVNPELAHSQDLWLHHFGESLLHPEFDRLIRYASSKGTRACLSLNPLMLTSSISKRLLEANPTKLVISLDGHDDASFEKIRGVPNAYGRSRDHLDGFLRLKTAGRFRSRVVLSMIDFSMNEASIADLKSFWQAMPGVDEFAPKPFTRWDGSDKDIVKLGGAVPANQRLRKQFRRPLCHVPWETLTVTWDGDVLPCCMDFNKKYVLGNVRRHSLTELWNGPKMRALRREFLANDVTNPLCRECDALYWGMDGDP